MKVTVRFTAEVAVPFQESFLLRVAEETLGRCTLPSLREREVVVLNAIAVSSEKIRTLNRTYREKDQATDVLSFGEYTDTGAFESDPAREVFLGELFFCQDLIAQAAAEDEVTLEHEMAYVFSHGVLHLLGYDHSDEMFALQDAVTAALMTESK